MFTSIAHRFRLLAVVLLAIGGIAASAVSAPIADATAPARLDISRSSVDFGDVAVGSAAQETVAVTNTGSGDVTIISVDGPAPQPPFTLNASGCGGKTLAPGAGCSVTTRFAPTSAGRFNAELQFSLGDSLSTKAFVVSLTGCGVTRINVCGVVAPPDATVVFNTTTTAPPTTIPTPTTTATTTSTATTAPSGGQPSGGQPSGTPAPGVPVDAVVHPLTGVAVTDPANHVPRPALVVKIDNADTAQPQTGLNQADIVYEEIIEDGATRFAAIFNSTDSNPVGPIRSARTQDIDLLGSLDTPILACSGANTAVTEALAATGWTVLTEPDDMFRADDRAAPHNLYANTTDLYTTAAAAGDPGTDADTGGAVPQFQYAEPDADIAGTPATAIDVRVGQVDVRWLWDELTGRYLRLQNGQPHLLTDGQAATDTVIIIVTDYTDAASPEAVTSGTGDVVVYTAGRKIEGIWTRESATDPFALEAAGAPILITPGHTWIELVNLADYDLADHDTTT